MTGEERILVVAATPRELPAGSWRSLHCGVGPVDAAARTAAALAADPPAAVLHVGIAGARSACAVAPGAVVIGSVSLYCDLDVPAQWAATPIAPADALVRAARHTLPHAILVPIGTSGRVGGSAGCDIEAMEGYAVLRAAELAGVPAIEVRVVSNVIEEADRALWRFDDAFAAIAHITPRLVTAIAQAVVDA